LVAAGIPDQPMQAYDERGPKALYHRSFHAMAEWTFEESAHRSLRRVRWRPHPEGVALGGGKPKNGVEPDPDVSHQGAVLPLTGSEAVL
jgi:hypothetical protein